MKPFYERNNITIYNADCLDALHQTKQIFDVAILDPPYFKIIKEKWDNQWKTLVEYIDWLEVVIIQVKRVLSPGGSLYVFADDKNAAYVQVMIDKHLTLLNSITWFKTNNLPIKATSNLRSYAPMTERILFYTPQPCPTGLETVKLDLNNFVSLRKYFRDYQEAIGLGLKQINERLGHRRAEHAFYWNSTQWDLPTKETYQELADVFPANGFLRREYEDLRREYEDLRRTFNADDNTLDVISGPVVSKKENTAHPTTKPLWLMSRLLQVSASPGDYVLDPFMGSGTTLVAALSHGIKAIGIDTEAEFCEIAKYRLRQPALFAMPEVDAVGTEAKQLELDNLKDS